MAGHYPGTYYEGEKQVQARTRIHGVYAPVTLAKVAEQVATTIHTDMATQGGVWYTPQGAVHFQDLVLLGLLHVSRVSASDFSAENVVTLTPHMFQGNWQPVFACS